MGAFVTLKERSGAERSEGKRPISTYVAPLIIVENWLEELKARLKR
jgi:hypothetical protein